MTSGLKARVLTAAILTGSLGLQSCTSTSAGPTGLYARPIGNAPVTNNSTPYTGSLECLGAYAAQAGITPPSVAVGRISDLTGKLDDNGGRTLTQGAMLMAISALGKAGVPLVERYETDILKLEYKLADAKLIGDGGPPGDEPDYQPIMPGQITKASYILTGGITELNTNIQTVTNGLTHVDRTHPANTDEIGTSRVVMNIGIDLRVVDSRTTRVVQVVSYQKQIVGAQVGVGLFTFFTSNTVSLGSTTNGQEPVHYAVRTLLERAVAEIVSRLYNAPAGACINPLNDPLGDHGAQPRVVATATPARVVQPAAVEPPQVYAAPQPVSSPPPVYAQTPYPAPALPFSPPEQPYGAGPPVQYDPPPQQRRYLQYPAAYGADRTPPYARQRPPPQR